jgi:hypothetical protein
MAGPQIVGIARYFSWFYCLYSPAAGILELSHGGRFDG